MGFLPWSLLFLVGLTALLGLCSGSSLHSLRYFHTAISEPGQGLPWFTTVGYVDDQLFIQYDSDIRRKLPRVPWIEKLVAEEDPHYWDRETHISQGNELMFRADLETVRKRYNQSTGGLHTLQWMYGCELRKDGSIGGFRQFSYDGRDFISLDLQTLTWTAADAGAQVTKSRWERENWALLYKAYMEEKCIDYLRKYLRYRNETLLRTVPPTVHAKCKAEDDGLETFVFRFHGFYPKEMDVNWMRDGQVWTQDTFQGRVAPNSDGTYYTWRSIKIHPKERDRYRVHVEHDGLEEPLDLAVEDSAVPGSVPVGVIVGSILGVLAVSLLIIGIVFYKKWQEKAAYKAAPASDQGSDNYIIPSV